MDCNSPFRICFLDKLRSLILRLIKDYTERGEQTLENTELISIKKIYTEVRIFSRIAISGIFFLTLRTISCYHE